MYIVWSALCFQINPCELIWALPNIMIKNDNLQNGLEPVYLDEHFLDLIFPHLIRLQFWLKLSLRNVNGNHVCKCLLQFFFVFFLVFYTLRMRVASYWLHICVFRANILQLSTRSYKRYRENRSKNQEKESSDVRCISKEVHLCLRSRIISHIRQTSNENRWSVLFKKWERCRISQI